MISLLSRDLKTKVYYASHSSHKYCSGELGSSAGLHSVNGRGGDISSTAAFVQNLILTERYEQYVSVALPTRILCTPYFFCNITG
jgi:hypothetical protein